LIDAILGIGARTTQSGLACIVALIAAVAPAWADTPPSRIVSINLCADELLVALADRSQIAALSPYAVDPTLSFVAREAETFRHDAAEAETVIDIDPDLVLAGRFTKLASREMLMRLGYRVVLLDAARSIGQSIDQIRQVAMLVGHPERGDALIAEIEAARERARTAAAALTSRPTAAVYQRRGYVTGAETLTGELMAAVGLDNQGGALAGKTGRFVPLERLVTTRPDYLVVASPDADAKDQGTALLAHPALAALYPPEKRIVLPERLTVCAGPSLPAALDWLAAQTARVAAGP
jgi:iron complex transport system substrate-binding protein